MKKIVSLVLSLILVLSLAAVLVACEEHECEFKKKWSYNEKYHWHECKGDNCLEVDDKGKHEWEEVIDEDTDEVTYECEVCGAIKDEGTDEDEADEDENLEVGVEVEEEEWEEAVADQKFDNVTINYTFATEDQGTQDHIVKITEDKVYRYAKITFTDGSGDEEEFTFEGEDAAHQRDMFLSIFLSILAEKENFTYDVKQKAYIMPEEVKTTLPQNEDGSYYILETMRDGKVVFDAKGNVVSFSFWISEASYMDGELLHETVGDIVLGFSDYGTTVVE